MKKSPSQRIGRCVGYIARRYQNRQWHQHTIGRLRRHVTSFEQMLVFRNDVIEKVVFQNHHRINVVHAIRASGYLMRELEKYDLEAFMQGFFETYIRRDTRLIA